MNMSMENLYMWILGLNGVRTVCWVGYHGTCSARVQILSGACSLM